LTIVVATDISAYSDLSALKLIGSVKLSGEDMSAKNESESLVVLA
jgi:hypothetical protein